MTGLASRRKGAGFELAVVHWLRANGVPHAERAPGMYAPQPNGDILGIPGVYLECKSVRTWDLAGWADRASSMTARAWAIIIKRKGHASPADAYVVTSLAQYRDLLAQAGYIPGRWSA